MRRSAISVGPERTIRDAATIMERAGVGALAVLDGDHLVGIVTEQDLVRRGTAKGLAAAARVDSVMSAPVVTVEAGADALETFTLFRTRPFRRLAVVRDARFLGIITLEDLLVELATDESPVFQPVGRQVPAARHDRRRSTAPAEPCGPDRMTVGTGATKRSVRS